MKSNLFRTINKYFTNKKFRFFINSEYLKLYNNMSDKKYLIKEYNATMGKKLNLDNPITYSEKLQWLKLNDRKDIYTTMVDKCKAKQFVSDIVGEEHTIPTIGIWDSFEEINFDKLPNQFVLKCNHDSGSIVICRDKSKLDLSKTKKIIEKSLKRNYFLVHREWPYKNIERKIMCEPLLHDDGDENSWLVDYKFFCFNGEPKLCYISRDRSENPTTDFFDMDFNHLPFRMKDPNSIVPPPKPDCFEQMKEISKKLSKGIPHLRVDFYYVNNHIYVGELTFYHCAGFVNIVPDEWNYKLGNMIDLSLVKSINK